MPTYAVSGASGHLGRLAVQDLLARGVPASDVVAVVRTRAKIADLASRGVQVREANYSRYAGVPFTLLRNGYYTDGYTAQLGEYLDAREIVGAVGSGRISAAPRQDYAAAAAADLVDDQAGNRTYELGGPAFGLPELARVITEVTGIKVTYHDLPAGEYASWLQRAGLDEATARFVAALDASVARGDLETSSQDLAHLLGRPATPLTEVVGTAQHGVLDAARDRHALKAQDHGRPAGT